MVNRSLATPKFTLKEFREAIRVARRHNQRTMYLSMEFAGKAVVASVLPFGLNLSPYVFTRTTNFLVRIIRKKIGAKAMSYTDDFLVGAQLKELLRARFLEKTAQEMRKHVKSLLTKEKSGELRVSSIGRAVFLRQVVGTTM